MRLCSWLSSQWVRIQGSIVSDVPLSLDECEDCRKLDCSQVKWLSCPRRLAGEAERLSDRGLFLDASVSSDGMSLVDSYDAGDARPMAVEDVESSGPI